MSLLCFSSASIHALTPPRDGSVQHGKPPASADRKAFAAHLNAARTTEAEGENFDEAYDALGSHVWRAFNAPAVPDEIEAMFKDVACEEVGPNVSRALDSVSCERVADTGNTCSQLTSGS